MSLESRLEAYISNNEDPAWNFNLGLEYEEIGGSQNFFGLVFMNIHWQNLNFKVFLYFNHYESNQLF